MGHPIVLEAEGAGPAAVGLPGLGQLLHLAPAAAALAVALVRSDRGKQSSEQQAVPGPEVHVAVERLHVAQADSSAHVREPLELDRPAVQPVHVPDDHPVPSTGLDVPQHPLVGRAGLAAVGADVVIDVLLRDRPAVSSGLGPADGKLPLDA